MANRKNITKASIKGLIMANAEAWVYDSVIQDINDKSGVSWSSSWPEYNAAFLDILAQYLCNIYGASSEVKDARRIFADIISAWNVQGFTSERLCRTLDAHHAFGKNNANAWRFGCTLNTGLDHFYFAPKATI